VFLYECLEFFLTHAFSMCEVLKDWLYVSHGGYVFVGNDSVNPLSEGSVWLPVCFLISRIVEGRESGS
jgi:hypothetical protein